MGVAIADIRDGLVGHWRFEEGAGLVAYDQSASRNHGTLTNAPTWVAGYMGNALHFDGNSAYVAIPLSTILDSLTSQMTFAAWINVASVHSNPFNPSIMYKGPGGGTVGDIQFHINDGDSIVRLALRGVGGFKEARANNAISIGSWVHYAGTADGSLIRLYENAALQTTTASFGVTLSHSGRPLAIAGFNNGTTVTRFFDGIIDEARVYNRALSQSEIAQIMSLPSLAVTPVNIGMGAQYI